MAIHRTTYLKVGLALLWGALVVWSFVWVHSLGIPARHLPRALYDLLHSTGWWGPIAILGLYLIRPLFFVPSSVLTIVAGTLYGPIGVVLNVLGDLISASVAFLLGRLFGRRFVREHEHGWIKKYDAGLKEEGFFVVLFMRLLFFPFDTVSIGCGMTGMLFRQFALGTLLGILPGTITLTLLGNVFSNPKTMVTFVALFVVTLVLVYFAQRSAWVRKRLFPKHTPPELITF